MSKVSVSSKLNKLAKEIEHLSSDEIEELYRRYLTDEKILGLLSEYKIDTSPNKLFNLFPPQEMVGNKCPYCGIPMWMKRKSRSGSNNINECYTCNHKSFPGSVCRTVQCCCIQCVTLRKEKMDNIVAQHRKVINEKYCPHKVSPKPYSELSFAQKLILLTLLQLQPSDNCELIQALDDPAIVELFFPTKEMAFNCLTELFSCHALIVDPESKLTAFNEDDGLTSFNMMNVQWIANITFNDMSRSSLKILHSKLYEELHGEVLPQWKQDMHKILFLIAQEEVLQYLYTEVDGLNFIFSEHLKVRMVISQLLQKFSVSELYCFVKSAVKHACAYYAKKRTFNKRITESVISNKILNLGGRAEKENWTTYKYARKPSLPRSIISKLFFDVVLGEQDAGFSKPPGKHWDDEICPKYF